MSDITMGGVKLSFDDESPPVKTPEQAPANPSPELMNKFDLTPKNPIKNFQELSLNMTAELANEFEHMVREGDRLMNMALKAKTTISLREMMTYLPLFREDLQKSMGMNKADCQSLFNRYINRIDPTKIIDVVDDEGNLFQQLPASYLSPNTLNTLNRQAKKVIDRNKQAVDVTHSIDVLERFSDPSNVQLTDNVKYATTLMVHGMAEAENKEEVAKMQEANLKLYCEFAAKKEILEEYIAAGKINPNAPPIKLKKPNQNKEQPATKDLPKPPTNLETSKVKIEWD